MKIEIKYDAEKDWYNAAWNNVVGSPSVTKIGAVENLFDFMERLGY